MLSVVVAFLPFPHSHSLRRNLKRKKILINDFLMMSNMFVKGRKLNKSVQCE